MLLEAIEKDAAVEISRGPRMLRYFRIGSLVVGHGSDHHAVLPQKFDNEKDNPFPFFLERQISEQHRRYQQKADVIILNGDHYGAPNGEPAQKAVAFMLNYMAEKHPDVQFIYVPGNHCLRGAGDEAWRNFGALRENILAPLGDGMNPVAITIKGIKIVAGNIFYDGTFLDPEPFGFKREEVEESYENSPDRKYLFNGRRDNFRKMADNLAAALQPDVNILVTHMLPHSLLATLRLGPMTDYVAELGRKNHVNIRHDPVYEEEQAAKVGITARQFRRTWSGRTLSNMGSNVLTRPGFPQDHGGLHIVYGHSHVSIKPKIRENGTPMFNKGGIPIWYERQMWITHSQQWQWGPKPQAG